LEEQSSSTNFYLKLMLCFPFYSFFNTHVIRVKLPGSMAVRSAGGRSTEVIDLQFPNTDEVEGRKKGGGGKMGKKMMMMMMMGLKAKMMMVGINNSCAAVQTPSLFGNL